MKTKIYTLAIIAIALIIFSSCSKEQTFEEKYAGAWELTFDGSFSGDKLVVIKSDGTFSFSVRLPQGLFGSITNTLTGTVNENGVLNGDIFMNGDDIGDVTGNLEASEYGDGIYVTDLSTEGTWIATKN